MVVAGNLPQLEREVILILLSDTGGEYWDGCEPQLVEDMFHRENRTLFRFIKELKETDPRASTTYYDLFVLHPDMYQLLVRACGNISTEEVRKKKELGMNIRADEFPYTKEYFGKRARALIAGYRARKRRMVR